MILPTKRIDADRSLLGLGARVLRRLERPKTVSRLWEEISRDEGRRVTYDWFVLSLDLLFMTGAVELRDGRLHRGRP